MSMAILRENIMRSRCKVMILLVHTSALQVVQSTTPNCHTISFIVVMWVGGTTGSASDQQSTNDRKVAGSRPTKVVCITVLTGNRTGWTARCGRPPLLLPSCRKLEFRLSALMDSDLAWVNSKSSRQSWRYADAFQRSIISEAIYHFITCWRSFTIDRTRDGSSPCSLCSMRSSDRPHGIPTYNIPICM